METINKAIYSTVALLLANSLLSSCSLSNRNSVDFTKGRNYSLRELMTQYTNRYAYPPSVEDKVKEAVSSTEEKVSGEEIYWARYAASQENGRIWVEKIPGDNPFILSKWSKFRIPSKNDPTVLTEITEIEKIADRKSPAGILTLSEITDYISQQLVHPELRAYKKKDANVYAISEIRDTSRIGDVVISNDALPYLLLSAKLKSGEWNFVASIELPLTYFQDFNYTILIPNHVVDSFLPVGDRRVLEILGDAVIEYPSNVTDWIKEFIKNLSMKQLPQELRE